ncbi:hypothetical protein F5Y00DRAFT_273167 [Daldinia vernicosa]|uniref:uncharacterized protein n=1 Tax=Daldinia vernicosa TaxID=114800 RepID=UPI0020081EA6|nr:uncharacterized protein F5Y00DRAFT_273167 [Daldinia vernicosa]KAI0852596.1 hypothetical protein F5Y00DRAFT_273167 [Daldinia vernicosa]
MSWMDSWSRPGKSQATPAPYYLLPGGESTPYCRSCGRVISSRRANTVAAAHDSSSNVPSYCSQRCRNTKPRNLDREIEATFVRMLSGGNGDGASQVRRDGKTKKRVVKGDPRVVVSCDEVEKAMFGDDHADPDKTFGRRKKRASRVLPATSDDDDGTEGDSTAAPIGEALEEDGDSAVGLLDDNEDESSVVDGDVPARMAVRSGTRIRPPQTLSQVNGSVGGEKGRAERSEETEENAKRRLQGQRRAQQREMVRNAARRGVVFGFAAAPRKCEAVMRGKVVEPSFAKGDWGIRWRE